jgi:uncharacterized membrane protein
MVVIVGLVVLLAAVAVGYMAVHTNAGAAHPLTDNFAVFGHHVTGSTGTLFLFGFVIGALAMLGLSIFLAGTRHTVGRGRDARREVKRSQREATFVNRDRDARPEHQPVAASGSRVNPAATTRRNRGSRGSLFGRWSRRGRTAHAAGQR